MNTKKIIISFLAAFGITFASFAPAFAATTTVVVTPNDLDSTSSNPAVVAADGQNKWFLYNDTNDTIDNTLGSFVNGPATPPHGVGSVEFTLGASPLDRKNIATYQFAGRALSTITTMGFTAYSHSGVAGATESPYLNFNVDFTGTSSSFQGRLVYVPSANGAVPQDTWNTYNTVNSGNALWTWSKFANNGNKWPDNNTNQYRTWNDILAAFPNARVLPGDGWLGVRVGEPGPTNYVGNVDSFTLGTAANTTVFDFEPAVGPPSSLDQCKNNGWKDFNNPSFKNQGQCVAYVATHNHFVIGLAKYNAYGLNRTANFAMTTALNSGTFSYSDANHDSYQVNVSEVRVNGNTAYFAGKVTHASNPSWIGQWLFAKVEDNSPDKISGSFTSQTAAVTGVDTMTNPADGPFTVTSGSISVH